MGARFSPKPPWLKVRAPGGDVVAELKRTLRRLDLHTVCEEARCPNVGECWREGTATVMLLGDVCTRGCRFCAVTTGNPRGAVDPREPEHVARAIASLGLTYVVLTMVNRDDLLDGGAAHVADTVSCLRALRSDLLIETLVGDFLGKKSDVDTVVDAAPDVFAHNVEVVRSATRRMRDARSSYEQSLEVLRHAKLRAPDRMTKSSLMVGVGETDDELLGALWDLRSVGVDVVTVGQYLQPSLRHAPVERFVAPETFDDYRTSALEMGFSYVASGPLVRSSYKAAEVYVRSRLTGEHAGAGDVGLGALGPRAIKLSGALGPRALEQSGDVGRALLDARLEAARREAGRVRAELGPEVVAREPSVEGGEGALATAHRLLPREQLVRR